MPTIRLLDQLHNYIQGVKDIPGVENVVVSQRDGYPITSCGVWLSDKEIFGLSATSSAILSVARRIHASLSYVLIEGERDKIMLIVLPETATYFLAITTLGNVNLGRIMLQAEKLATHIGAALRGVEFTPPLRSYEEEDRKAILRAFNVYFSGHTRRDVRSVNICITDRIASRITEVIGEFLSAIPAAKMGLVCLDGGYLIPTSHIDEKDAVRISTLTYTLFDASRTAAQIAKRTRVRQVLCDCNGYLHFVYGLTGGLFSTIIPKDSVRLGLLRLVIPNFTSEIENVLRKATQPREIGLDVRGILEAIA